MAATAENPLLAICAPEAPIVPKYGWKNPTPTTVGLACAATLREQRIWCKGKGVESRSCNTLRRNTQRAIRCRCAPPIPPTPSAAGVPKTTRPSSKHRRYVRCTRNDIYNLASFRRVHFEDGLSSRLCSERFRFPSCFIMLPIKGSDFLLHR